MKPWRSWGEQLQLFKDRGLILSSGDDCLKFLKQVGYYRFSGYCRYFQKSPEDGVNEFISGVTFDQIFEIYSLDQGLHQFLMGPISQIEILLRNRYAYMVAEKGGAYGEYLCDSYFSGAESSESLSEACIRDIERSKDRHILRYRDDSASEKYAKLPVWSAVEAFSFGTLSKCIERGQHGQMSHLICEDIGLAKSGFPSRLRSIVYLRNRCAHYGRLWNHCVIDAGAVPHNVRNKAKRRLAIGNFTPRSIMDVIVSLDDFLKKMNIRSDFLEQFEQLFMLDNDVFRRGMIDPRSTKDRYQH